MRDEPWADAIDELERLFEADPEVACEVVTMLVRLGLPLTYRAWWYWYPTWTEIWNLPETVDCPGPETCL